MHVGIAVHCYLVFVNERPRYILLTFDVNLYFSHFYNKVFYTQIYQNEFNNEDQIYDLRTKIGRDNSVK